MTQIINAAAKLYNERYKEFGADIKTVGWKDKESQQLRFEVLIKNIDLNGKTILDVGCGLGGLVDFLYKKKVFNFNYIGIDVAKDLIDALNQKKYSDNINFFYGDIFSLNLSNIDVSILSGALSYKQPGIKKSAKQTLFKMYDLSKEVACLNFLSSYVDYEADINVHYQPEAVFAWAKEVSKKVRIYNDYPLYEFTVQVLK